MSQTIFKVTTYVKLFALIEKTQRIKKVRSPWNPRNMEYEEYTGKLRKILEIKWKDFLKIYIMSCLFYIWRQWQKAHLWYVLLLCFSSKISEQYMYIHIKYWIYIIIISFKVKLKGMSKFCYYLHWEVYNSYWALLRSNSYTVHVLE